MVIQLDQLLLLRSDENDRLDLWCANGTYIHVFRDLGRVSICDPSPLCGSILVLSQASFTSFLRQPVY